jgi:hypothetical protein
VFQIWQFCFLFPAQLTFPALPHEPDAKECGIFVLECLYFVALQPARGHRNDIFHKLPVKKQRNVEETPCSFKLSAPGKRVEFTVAQVPSPVVCLF